MFQMSRRKGRPLFRGRNPRQTTNISLKLNGNLDLPIAGLVVVSFVYPSSSLLYGPSANATTTADNNGSNVPPRNSSSLTHTRTKRGSMEEMTLSALATFGLPIGTRSSSGIWQQELLQTLRPPPMPRRNP